MLSFVILLAGVCAGNNGKGGRPRPGLAQRKLLSFYFTIQFLVGGIAVMFLPSPDRMVVLAAEIIFLLLFLIIMVFLKAGSAWVQGRDEKTARSLVDVRGMVSQAEAAGALLKDTQLRQSMDHLTDSIRYMDPMHTAETENIEDRIRDNLDLLKAEAKLQEYDTARERISRIENMVKERSGMLR